LSSPSALPPASRITANVPAAADARWWPVFALMFGATSWGILWYPFRLMQAGGLPVTIATFLAYLVMFVAGAIVLRRVWGEVIPHWQPLLCIAMAAGVTNVSYLVAVMQAEVVRIVLLFYLSTLWTVPLARWLLKEKLTWAGYATMALAMCGAFVMLLRPELGLPAPRSAHEWLGLTAGITFALSNVLVRRAKQVSPEAKTMAAGFGVAAIALPVALFVTPDVAAWAAMAAPHWWLVAIVGLALLLTSVTLQYGLSRVSANRAAVILLFELIIAAIAAHYLANEVTRLQDWIGGAMIVSAGVIATLGGRH
jgi:drug/metabolite transporter (DMT)-like permease